MSRHSANLIKLGTHEVMSADSSCSLASPKEENGKEIQVNCVLYFLSGTFAEQISPQLSAVTGQIPISEETGILWCTCLGA